MQFTLLELLKFFSRQCLFALTINILTLQLLIAGEATGQDLKGTRISLEVENEKLVEIFARIEGKSKYVFVYPEAVGQDTRSFSFHYANETLETILTKLGTEANFKFRNAGFTISIAPQSAKVQSADYILTGTVTTEEDGSTLPGVSVVIKGSGFGATTDSQGNYSINIATGTETLSFSFIGYATQEVPIGGRTRIDIVMLPDIATLSEVVVVAYGEQRKESVVGAISTVNARDVRTAAPRSLNNALVGKIAGLIAVQRSGEPGYDDAQFWIRGVSTFAGGSNPLILVDGVERPLNNIEPEEIESYSVLKDAAATAVYGIRGANGVILVTTRRGSTDKPVVSVKTERGFVGATRLPDFVDAPTYLTLYNEARIATNPSFQTQYTPEIIEKYRSGEDPYLYPNVDWVDLMVKDWSTNERTNLNVTGGGENAKYFLSATYYREDGIWKGDNLNKYNTNAGLKRYNFRANTDVNLRKDTQLGLGISGILVTANYPGTGADNIWLGGPGSGYGGGIMYNTPIGYAPTYPNPDDEGILYGGINGVENPYELLTGRGFSTQWRNNVQSDITLRHDLSRFVKGLKIEGKYAFDAYNYHFINRTRASSRYIATGRDPVANDLILQHWYEGQTDLGFGKQSGGNRRIYLQANINYDRSFGDHTFSTLLLYNQQDYQNADAGGAIDALPFRYQGLVGRISYNYKLKYFAELSSGYNGSENFQKGNRFGFFPALALGWIVSEEPFFTNDYVQYFKIRGSYGLKGNDQIGGRRFAYLTTMGGGNGGYNLGIDANNNIGSRGEDQWGSDLGWEVEREFNIGTEIRFLKGFYVQADVFSRHRTDILIPRNSLPNTMGLKNNPFGNLGEMKNKGIDASLEYKVNVGTIDIAVRGNYTFARNKIIDQDQPDWKYTYLNREGKRYNQPFGLIADGLFDDEEDIASSPEQPYGNLRPGDIKYKDINGDGRIDSFDEVAIGNPSVPEVVYGFGTTIAYKRFDISVFFQGAANMSFMLGGVGFFPFVEEGNRGSVSQHALDRWTPENPREDVLFPRLSYGASSINNMLPSTWWQRDASYLRLKTAEIGYTLPQALAEKLKIRTLRVYANGFNLHMWSKFKFWDPELGNGNGAKYPIQRNFNFGVNVNF